MLAALVVYVAPTLHAPLLEGHVFRQTQTAWTAREFREEGIDFLHPKLPVFAALFEAPFEFPLFQALAMLPMDLGVAEDTALRLTCLVCFVLTALLLWGLVRHVAGPASGVGAVGRVHIHAVCARLEPHLDDRVPRDRRSGRVRVRRAIPSGATGDTTSSLWQRSRRVSSGCS